jgi:putative ABC transport system permease protein
VLRNYLKVALRALRKQKVVSIVTIGSLAVGLACCLLLFLYVQQEWTYDQFHEHADRIHRVVNVEETPGGKRVRTAQGKAAVGPMLAENVAGIEQAVRFTETSVDLTVGAQTFEGEDVTLADSSVFEVFDGFRLRRGNEQTALAQPGSVVLTEEAAQRFFGEKNPMGRRLRVAFNADTLAATVTGLLDAPPKNSSLPFEVVLPLENMKKNYPAQIWDAVSANISFARTYVRLAESADAQALAKHVNAFMEGRAEGNEDSAVAGENERAGYRLQPLTDVHLDPSVKDGLAPTSNPMYSYILAGIALGVLLLACINFMTLSLGRSAGRAREVGIRKTVGARREQVAAQFWGEAVLTTLFALVLGTGLARLTLPVFNRLTGKELQFGLFSDPSLGLALAGLVAVVGLVAGGYPALVLSSFAPTTVLRGSGGRLGGRSRLARGLVIVQFALSIALVAGVLIMSQQLGYLTENSVNAEAEQIVRVESGTEAAGTEGYDPGSTTFYDRFRQEARRQSGIETVAGAWWPFPGGAFQNNLTLGDTAKVRTYMNSVSTDFLDMMGIELVAGRRLGTGAADGNRQPALVNRALVREMGWPSAEAAVGKQLPLEMSFGRNLREYEGVGVVGVVEDFPFQTLREQVEPLVLSPFDEIPGPAQAIFVRFRSGNTQNVLASLEDVWAEVAPSEASFEYAFLDEVVRQQYEAERQWRALVRYAAGLALLISCAGLFGLALLTVRRREKEIGIRKVLGASATNVVGLVARQFALLVAVGFALAVPLAWWGARQWLETFAYRIDLGAGPFLVAGAAVLVVAMATVGYQALRAARANPVEALRDE